VAEQEKHEEWRSPPKGVASLFEDDDEVLAAAEQAAKLSKRNKKPAPKVASLFDHDDVRTTAAQPIPATPARPGPPTPASEEGYLRMFAVEIDALVPSTDSEVAVSCAITAAPCAAGVGAAAFTAAASDVCASLPQPAPAALPQTRLLSTKHAAKALFDDDDESLIHVPPAAPASAPRPPAPLFDDLDDVSVTAPRKPRASLKVASLFDDDDGFGDFHDVPLRPKAAAAPPSPPAPSAPSASRGGGSAGFGRAIPAPALPTPPSLVYGGTQLRSRVVDVTSSGAVGTSTAPVHPSSSSSQRVDAWLDGQVAARLQGRTLPDRSAAHLSRSMASASNAPVAMGGPTDDALEAAAGGLTGLTHVWLWEDGAAGSGAWQLFDAASEETLRCAEASGATRLRMDIRGQAYDVDLLRFTQQNVRTGFVRHLKRHAVTDVGQHSSWHDKSKPALLQGPVHKDLPSPSQFPGSYGHVPPYWRHFPSSPARTSCQITLPTRWARSSSPPSHPSEGCSQGNSPSSDMRASAASLTA